MSRRRIVRRSPHGPDCRHCPRVRALGREFHLWRYSWELRRESEAAGYAAESAAFDRDNPPPTFRSFLVAMAGTGWPMSGSAA